MTAFEFRAVVAVVAVGYVLISLVVSVWVLFVRLNETHVEKQQWMWKHVHTKEAMQVDLGQAQEDARIAVWQKRMREESLDRQTRYAQLLFKKYAETGHERNHLRIMATRMADDLVLANARAARWQEIAMRKGMQLTEEKVYNQMVYDLDRIIAGK